MRLSEAIRAAKRVYLIGNGGSYANAIHIANDLLAAGIKAYTLDAATLTASANDFGYETVFARWIAAVGEDGDLLIALTGSGNSPNIIAALGEAKQKGMHTFAITGGGLASQIAENTLITTPRVFDMQLSEEAQLHEGHIAMHELKK